ncbi:MAG: hypothetical protein ABIP39_03390 [Polyangiaceae bacterium]
MRRSASALLLALLVASCGYDGTEVAPPGVAPGIVNGSRLRARVYAMEGGSHVFRGWYDPIIGTACTFALASDGALRCLPSNDVAQVEVVFADEDCTHALAANRRVCAPVPAFLREETPSHRCDFATIAAPLVTRSKHVFPDQMSVVYTKNIHGSCLAHGAHSLVEDYYDADPMDPKVFVAGTLGGMDAHGSRLVESTITGDDGSQQGAGMFDTERHEACASLATMLGRGTDLCIPEMAWGTDRYFSDSKCHVRVAYQAKLMQSCPKAGIGVDELGEPDATFFSPGDEVSITTIYSTALGPRCASLRSSPSVFNQDKLDHAFYELGAPIAASVFAPLTTKQVGKGRLVSAFHATPGGDLLDRSAPSWSFTDNGAGAACELVRFGDGRLRCISDFATFFDSAAIYGDDACTHPVIVISSGSPTYAVRSAEACGPPWLATGIYSIGEELTGPSFVHAGGAASCTARTAYAGEHAHEFGAPVALSVFATVFETVE